MSVSTCTSAPKRQTSVPKYLSHIVSIWSDREPPNNRGDFELTETDDAPVNSDGSAYRAVARHPRDLGARRRALPNS